MKIRELFEYEQYANNADFAFEEKIRNAKSICDSTVTISIDEARKISFCLNLLRQILTQSIDQMSFDVNLTCK